MVAHEDPTRRPRDAAPLAWSGRLRRAAHSAGSGKGVRPLSCWAIFRDNRPRSADATVTSSPLSVWSRHRATIWSSPEPGACTVVTPAASPCGTPARAVPSSTSTTISNDRSAFLSSAWSLAAAPARSRHQPSGRQPTTFAPSTTKTFTGRSFHLRLLHRERHQDVHPQIHPCRSRGDLPPSGVLCGPVSVQGADGHLSMGTIRFLQS